MILHTTIPRVQCSKVQHIILRCHLSLKSLICLSRSSHLCISSYAAPSILHSSLQPYQFLILILVLLFHLIYLLSLPYPLSFLNSLLSLFSLPSFLFSRSSLFRLLPSIYSPLHNIHLPYLSYLLIVLVETV